MTSTERDWVGVALCASLPTELGCMEAAFEADSPSQLPYVDIGWDGYGATHPAAFVNPSGAGGAEPPCSPGSEPQRGNDDGSSDAGGAASPGSGAWCAGGYGGAKQGGGRRYPTVGVAAAEGDPSALAGERGGCG